MKVRVDLDALAKWNATLAKIVAGRFNLDSGTHEIELNDLTEDTRKMLHSFFSAQLKKAAEEHNAQFVIDPTETSKRQQIVDGEAALVRLKEYAAQGLEDSQHNAEAIEAWITQNAGGYWSVAGVDAAISNLAPKGTNVLRWKTSPAAPQPAPVPEPEGEVVVTLADGSPQLSLDTVPSYSHSKAQLLDLDKRQRSARGRKREWHGVSM